MWSRAGRLANITLAPSPRSGPQAWIVSGKHHASQPGRNRQTLWRQHQGTAPVRAARPAGANARTTNGATGSAWRVYGPDQIARLHQILALKRLGLVKAARAKLAAGDMLSIDDLANLTRETVMTRMDAKDMSQTLKPFADRHLSGDEKDAYRARLTIDLETLRRAVNDLMQEAQPLMEVGDHTCPAAQNLAGRWRVAQSFPKADSDMRAKVCATWADAMADPAVGQKLALNRDIFRFVQQAVDHHKALEK